MDKLILNKLILFGLSSFRISVMGLGVVSGLTLLLTKTETGKNFTKSIQNLIR